MPICPAGHETSQTDFCDTCGLPVAAGQEAAPATATPVAATPVVCPHCHAPNVADALFCEACGFDFTTGVMPAAPAAPPVIWPGVAAPGPAPLAPVVPAPVVPDLAQAPVPAESGPVPAAPDAPPHPHDAAVTHDVVTERDPEADFEAESPAPHVEAGDVAAVPDVPVRPAVEWVAELWIDPDWYAAQGSTDPLPSAGLPDIVPLVRESNLIGRVSHSRGIFPDVDCELDTGCSRRHAMLTTDGTRWWIEDLDSANGTFVGGAAGPLPAMPIPQGRVELGPGQRIYVGAWTRIVVRRATDDEKEALDG